MTTGFELVQKSASAEPDDRQGTVFVAPDGEQGSTVAGQRKGVDWATSRRKGHRLGCRMIYQTEHLGTA